MKFILVLPIIFSLNVYSSTSRFDCYHNSADDKDLKEFRHYISKFATKDYIQGIEDGTLTHRKKEIVIDHDLRTEEIMAIRLYTASFYQAENSLLRNNPENISPFVKVLCAALQKLPTSKNILYRGAILPNEVVKRYKVGTIIREEAFTSTSEDEQTAKHFAVKPTLSRKVMFVFKTIKGANIDLVSIYEEHEYLIPAGTEFKVVSSTMSAEGIQVIELEDI